MSQTRIAFFLKSLLVLGLLSPFVSVCITPLIIGQPKFWRSPFKQQLLWNIEVIGYVVVAVLVLVFILEIIIVAVRDRSARRQTRYIKNGKA